jgi:hypothetical protein
MWRLVRLLETLSGIQIKKSHKKQGSQKKNFKKTGNSKKKTRNFLKISQKTRNLSFHKKFTVDSL